MRTNEVLNSLQQILVLLKQEELNDPALALLIEQVITDLSGENSLAFDYIEALYQFRIAELEHALNESLIYLDKSIKTGQAIIKQTALIRLFNVLNRPQ